MWTNIFLRNTINLVFFLIIISLQKSNPYLHCKSRTWTKPEVTSVHIEFIVGL